MKFSDLFLKEYYSRLDSVRKRGDSLFKTFQLLEEKNKDSYSIIETGCARHPANFDGDGCSTLLFDKFVNHVGGSVTSVDVSEENCSNARTLVSDKTTVICSDSVKFLWDLSPTTTIDLLYLDSYDFVLGKEHESQMHHLKELCAVISKLKSGALILVDDDDALLDGSQRGKGTYVKEFMNDIGAYCYFQGYQVGWILT